MIIKKDSIIKLIILSLPFMYFLTIDIGFPLKIYEVLIAFLFLTLPFTNQNLMKFNKYDSIFIKFILVLLVYLSFSYIVGLYNIGQLSIIQGFNSWRSSLIFAGLTKIIYIAMIIIFLFFLFKSYLSSKEMIKYWLYGSVLSSLYGFLVYIFLPTDLRYLRMITFLEGNFAGSFFILSIALSSYLFLKERKRRYILFIFIFTLSVLETESTVAIINLLLFYFIIFLYISIKKKKFIIILFPMAFLVVLFFLQTEYAQGIIFDKLTAEEVTYKSFSRIDRLNSILIAIEIFKDYPIFGSGLGTYGFLFPIYENSLMLFYGYGVDVFSYKRIVNNMYIELLSESGIVGLSIFLMFLLYLHFEFFKSKKSFSHIIIYFGFLSILIAWNAYPSYTSLYHWVYIFIYYKIMKEEKNVYS